jgi:hypothetical protein
MWTPSQQAGAMQSAQAVPLPMHQQALALAARLSPQANAARNSFGGTPAGMHAGPMSQPFSPPNAAAGAAGPAQAQLQGNYATTPALLGRWSSPQSGATLG